MSRRPAVSDRRLGSSARIWLRLSRAARPVSALALFIAGAASGSRMLKAGARAVLHGNATLVGPSRDVRTGDGTTVSRGVFSDARVSRAMNLELPAGDSDRAYVANMGPRADAALLAKGLWATLLGGRPRRTAGHHFNLFDIVVNNSEAAPVVRTIECLAMSHPNLAPQLLGGVPGFDWAMPAHVCFVNANNLNLAVERPEYMRILRQADVVLPDGIGVKLGLRIAGGSLRRNLNGTDLFPHVAEMLARNEWPVYLLGGEPGVLARAASNIAAAHPGLRICGMRDGYFGRDDEKEVSRAIRESGAIAVIVGMGTPRQETWFARNGTDCGVPLVLCMGGLLDFLGGKNRRAPLWMRQAGLEWVYRIVQEPGRMWKRYVVGNPLFLWRTARWLRARTAH